jgi:hypothetical protein
MTHREYHYLLNCPCGEVLSGQSEEEIVETAFAHLRQKHPDVACDYDREDVLALTRRLVRA